MQSTQHQIFYGVTAISCAYLLYSITKKKTSKKDKNKTKKNKQNDTPKYTFGTKQGFRSYLDRRKSTIDYQILNHKTIEQAVGFEKQQQQQINKNVKQKSSKEVEIPQDQQFNDYNFNSNQISDDEDQLFFKLGYRLLNNVKG